MDYENFGALDASIQEKVDSDNDFQGTLGDLSDEDKENAIKSKKNELIDEAIKEMSLGSKKSKELADNYKSRAEKAEQALKNKPNGEGNSNADLPTKDIFFLSKADIHEDDIEEVVDMAKLKKISVSEAYKYLKPILETRSEERKSASVANTVNVRRGNAKVSDDELISQANAGKLPESDDDINRLFQARSRQKR